MCAMQLEWGASWGRMLAHRSCDGALRGGGCERIAVAMGLSVGSGASYPVAGGYAIGCWCVEGAAGVGVAGAFDTFFFAEVEPLPGATHTRVGSTGILRPGFVLLSRPTQLRRVTSCRLHSSAIVR